jgi:hypothetical protein
MEIRDIHRPSETKLSTSDLPDLYDNEGLLRLFVEECERCAPERRQPFLALGAALAVVGALAGRRYASPTGLRTNVCHLGLGPSSCGKNTAQDLATELLVKATFGHYLTGDPQSGNALMGELVAHPVRLLVMDELGQWIAKMTSPKAPQHTVAIKRNMMTLFSSAHRTVAGSTYANPNERARHDIIQPHLCVYGAGTPERFFEAIRGGAIMDGFVPRFLLFKPDVDYPPLVVSPQLMNVSDEMIEAAKRIEGGGGAVEGNLPHHMSTMEPTVRTVPWSVDGEAEHERWRTGIREDRLTSAKTEAERVLVGKWSEHAIKLAMIRAISRDPVNPEMSASDAEWAWRLAEHCISTMLAMVQRHVAENDHERMVKEILNAISDAGRDGITKKALNDKVKWISMREREPILADLINDGTIRREKTRPTRRGGPPSTRFFATA